MVSLEDAPRTERLRTQLEGLDYWLEELSQSIDCSSDELSFVLLGNKADVTEGSKECPTEQLLFQWI